MSDIIYTKTDEAPLFATYSFLPILEKFAKSANISIGLKDISLSKRILASFNEFLPQDFEDDLEYLSSLIKKPDANIIKLPNISASIPQLKNAIAEIQKKGYPIPDFPENPKNAEEEKIKLKYEKILGSAVNPVLRNGNSDRRIPLSVKKFAKKNPYKINPWDKTSKTSIAHMNEGDFYGNEQSITFNENTNLKIEFINNFGNTEVLKESIFVEKGEIIDSTFLSAKAFLSFTEEKIQEAKKEDILLSLHLKATMMKTSDPVMFGWVVYTFFKDVFIKHKDVFKELEINQNNGLGEIYSKISSLPKDLQEIIKNDISLVYKNNPKLAMVDSSKGITNLHAPNKVIIDASMPAMIKSSGKMWDENDSTKDTLALIPDRTYASIYQAVIDDCKINGAFDPSIIGSVSNVGLMAKKAEEYGSHDKTFIIKNDGLIKVKNSNGKIIFEHKVEKGDIYRMCQAKDDAIVNWIKLAVQRAKISKTPAIFCLDKNRAHDKEIIKKVEFNLSNIDTTGLEISILSPKDGIILSLKRIRAGKDTICVTGNVLRDYMTDLFPILEIGTSAKMLSIVPLLNGGSLFETGAGGSAPKHAQQLLDENHLRWDSLGEFLALGASFEHLGIVKNNILAKILAQTLDQAVGKLLEEKKSPSRKCGELDNRGSHFYLAMYWAQALGKQEKNKELKILFSKIADDLMKNENKIINELNEVQGKKINTKDYYMFDENLANEIMRPSKTFNEIISKI